MGPDTSDDAGVYSFGSRALAATADFITPMCDDPRRFGRVAAVNSLSDIYAMGGSPLFALNLCCFPEDAVPAATLSEILGGGLEALQEAGAVLLGGHSVRDAELKFGLAVVGEVDPDRLLTNGGAIEGQRLLLTKPLGTGAIVNGFRKDALDEDALEPALKGMERLNDVAARLALAHGATACTDVTGYGLAGHALEIARASGAGLRIRVEELPAYPGFDAVHEAGIATRGARANEAAAAEMSEQRAGIDSRDRHLLHDPQTSGGLLIAVPEEAAEELLRALHDAGQWGWDVGEVLAGPPRLEVD